MAFEGRGAGELGRYEEAIQVLDKALDMKSLIDLNPDEQADTLF